MYLSCPTFHSGIAPIPLTTLSFGVKWEWRVAKRSKPSCRPRSRDASVPNTELYHRRAQTDVRRRKRTPREGGQQSSSHQDAVTSNRDHVEQGIHRIGDCFDAVGEGYCGYADHFESVFGQTQETPASKRIPIGRSTR